MTDSNGGPDRGQRFFAKFWQLAAPAADKQFAQQKDTVLTDLPSRIVELGPGLGSNFRRYPPGSTVVCFEPNKAMHEGLLEEADTHGITAEIRAEDFRAAGMAADSEEAVVATLVLCSVGDQSEMVEEVKRVLKPGGRFMFIEHVASENEIAHRLQKLVRKPWAMVGDGCDPAAPTVDAVENAGFASVSSTRAPIGLIGNPTRPAYWGVAVK